MDVASSYLFVTAKIERTDDANFANADEIGPVNNFLQWNSGQQFDKFISKSCIH